MRYIFFLLLSSLFAFATTLHLATSSNPSRLNPILATDSSSSEIAGFIFNGLLKYDKDSSTIIGDLASKFYYENNTSGMMVKNLQLKMFCLHMKLWCLQQYLHHIVQILGL